MQLSTDPSAPVVRRAAMPAPRPARTPESIVHRTASNFGWRSFTILALLLVLAPPLLLDPFRLGLVAKYLCFAFAAVGVVLVWGYGGILSLGQGIFFGLGSYSVAMFLKLEAAGIAGSGSALSEFYNSKLPDFMVWNSIESLPWWWQPFEHLGFALAAAVVLPVVVAFVLAYANFRKRVGGVYFSIVTLALASIMAIVIVGQQGVTGGVNGITDFRTFAGLPLDGDGPKRWLYFITVALLLGCLLVARRILASRLGKVLVAIRDREDRVRFSGYDPALFKAFIFAVAALMTAIGGGLFTLQQGLASPSLIGIVPSIEMVIYAAVGGRLSLIGAVYGTLLVLAAKTYFSEEFLEYWPYLIGMLFIVVVRFLPTGLAGLAERLGGAWRARVDARHAKRASRKHSVSALLEVRGLTVSFDGFRAVDDLSLAVDENELRCVIGPNGAGKTTLLDMICGKTKASAGQIRFRDRDLTHLLEYEITRAGIGRKFQTPSTYEDLTVRENLEISDPAHRGVFACLFFHGDARIDERVERIAEEVYLDEQLGTKAGSLSHGQKQWLEIGMLLMQESRLLLLDEPVAGMTAREREATGALLKRIASGRSLVVIEHDMGFVRSIADRVTVLHQGKVLAEGSMDAVQADERVIDVYLGH